jgi:malate synthase
LKTISCPVPAWSPPRFGQALADIVARFSPRNRELLAIRDEMQNQISAWHKANPGADYDRAAYKKMLEEIGYLLPQPAPFKIATQNVDP